MGAFTPEEVRLREIVREEIRRAIDPVKLGGAIRAATAAAINRSQRRAAL